ATPKKREEARKKGQVAKSRDAASVAVLLACLVFFWFGASGMFEKTMALARGLLTQSAQFNVDCNNIQGLSISLVYKISALLFPLFLTAFSMALLVNYLQVGFVLSAESVQPKLSKIDPIKGFQKLFSIRSLVELAKNIFKISIVGFSVWGILIYIAGVAFKIVLMVCLALIILAILDYIYQKWEFEKNLKMTKQEVKDESRQTEGDPLVKARIRRLQRDMARKRMMASVPEADVVITNPTHLAVALRYDQTSVLAPKVVAKGAGFIAENIKDIARKNNVPIVNNKPLARVLYKSVDVDEIIPANLYRAVAEVLAFVYSRKR
ncbi:MAG: EscU/YscU/HrcU family type III secretion system export apparatus switch protein, partial [Deltaproteobacteria bacterium]|nr:EscU/YscU/HrcU family type III secretion system export apparatus switch protein [Deltaproteobacteria bacterium]